MHECRVRGCSCAHASLKQAASAERICDVYGVHLALLLTSAISAYTLFTRGEAALRLNAQVFGFSRLTSQHVLCQIVVPSTRTDMWAGEHLTVRLLGKSLLDNTLEDFKLCLATAGSSEEFIAELDCLHQVLTGAAAGISLLESADQDRLVRVQSHVSLVFNRCGYGPVSTFRCAAAVADTCKL